MELIQKQNIFEFHDSSWKQEVGAAKGGRPIPVYDNTFMTKIDALIKGQRFCDLPTHLHHLYHVFHAIRINKCNFFSSN